MAMTWEFEDARGVVHRGWVKTVYDYGGTDVTHAMVAGCGAYVMLSGSRLKAARTLGAVKPDCTAHKPTV